MRVRASSGGSALRARVSACTRARTPNLPNKFIPARIL